MMSMFKTLSRANRSIQVEGWTTVELDIATGLRIYDDNSQMITDLGLNPSDHLSLSATYNLLNHWCRNNIKGGFSIIRSDFTYDIMHSFKSLIGFTVAFQKSTEAVRFKITWGGR